MAQTWRQWNRECLQLPSRYLWERLFRHNSNHKNITFRPISDEVSNVERSVYSYIDPCFAAVPYSSSPGKSPTLSSEALQINEVSISRRQIARMAMQQGLLVKEYTILLFGDILDRSMLRCYNETFDKIPMRSRSFFRYASR